MGTKSLSVIMMGLMASAAFGSGFKCEGEEVRVKLFNHTNPHTGTRVPAAMVISTDAEGTLLVRKGDEIRKHNRRNTVQYVVDGNSKLAADQAILQIRFKEGRETLEEGEVASGQLILVSEESDRSVTELACERYLKSE